MAEQPGRTAARVAIYIVTALAAAIVIYAAAKRNRTDGVEPPSLNRHDHEHHNPLPAAVEIDPDPNKPAGGRITKPSSIPLKDIIASAKSWGPDYTGWYGRQAPNFTITDINGARHSLADYQGKNIMLVFWATWCGPCKIEIPHLIALRNRMDKDTLAILAISRENPELVKRFARQVKLNYTVAATDTDKLPAPFDQVTSIPCSFFIRPDGTIKAATVGTLSLGDMRALVEAK